MTPWQLAAGTIAAPLNPAAEAARLPAWRWALQCSCSRRKNLPDMFLRWKFFSATRPKPSRGSSSPRGQCPGMSRANNGSQHTRDLMPGLNPSPAPHAASQLLPPGTLRSWAELHHRHWGSRSRPQAPSMTRTRPLVHQEQPKQPHTDLPTLAFIHPRSRPLAPMGPMQPSPPGSKKEHTTGHVPMKLSLSLHLGPSRQLVDETRGYARTQAQYRPGPKPNDDADDTDRDDY